MSDSRPDPRTQRPPAYDLYPGLANLIYVYFGQDYDEISENPEEIFAAYREREQPFATFKVVSDIERFLAEHESSGKPLAESFRTIFGPGSSLEGWYGLTLREWLGRGLEILSGTREPEPIAAFDRTPATQDEDRKAR